MLFCVFCMWCTDLLFIPPSPSPFNHVRTPLLFVQRSLGRGKEGAGSGEQGRIVDGPRRSLADPMQPLIDCWRGGREGEGERFCADG